MSDGTASWFQSNPTVQPGSYDKSTLTQGSDGRWYAMGPGGQLQMVAASADEGKAMGMQPGANSSATQSAVNSNRTRLDSQVGFGNQLKDMAGVVGPFAAAIGGAGMLSGALGGAAGGMGATAGAFDPVAGTAAGVGEGATGGAGMGSGLSSSLTSMGSNVPTAVGGYSADAPGFWDGLTQSAGGEVPGAASDAGLSSAANASSQVGGDAAAGGAGTTGMELPGMGTVAGGAGLAGAASQFAQSQGATMDSSYQAPSGTPLSNSAPGTNTGSLLSQLLGPSSTSGGMQRFNTGNSQLDTILNGLAGGQGGQNNSGGGLGALLGTGIGAIGMGSANDAYAAAIKQAAAAADPYASQRPAMQQQFADQVKNFPGNLQTAASTADPFSAFRQQNQQLYGDLTSGKTNLNDTPWMQNLTNTAVDQSAQRLSSKYGGDVNSLGMRSNIANSVNAQNAPVAMSYLNSLLNAGTNTSSNAASAGNILGAGNTSLLTATGNAAGANINPQSGQILGQGALQQYNNSNSLAGTLGSGFNNLLQPNTLDSLSKLYGSISGGGSNTGTGVSG
jgi:hypothetical protein